MGITGEKINANPTKEFFIRMLTRDIEIEPAIAELVDNSIDGAKAFQKNRMFIVKLKYRNGGLMKNLYCVILRRVIRPLQ